MKFTQFYDMHSGGYCKESPYERIYIEGDMDAAVDLFEQKFGRNPFNVTCNCCGEDYSVSEYESLEEASAYERRCDWGKDDREYDLNTGNSLEEYLKKETVLVLRADGTPYVHKG